MVLEVMESGQRLDFGCILKTEQDLLTDKTWGVKERGSGFWPGESCHSLQIGEGTEGWVCGGQTGEGPAYQE